MSIWKKLNQDQIKERIFGALSKNVNYFDQNILGIPASHLDGKVFQRDTPFLKDAPYFSTLLHNPNHIGCHTLGSSESFFVGTQEIEREVIEICANEILKGGNEEFDGYVASGGTEANMQAIWIYRNYYRREFGASNDQICILNSTDSHYSMAKAGNVFSLDQYKVKVEEFTRAIDTEDLKTVISNAKDAGKKYFIVVGNMMTTMFGSVDFIKFYTDELEAQGCEYKLHLDGAYGGFYYPFTNKNTSLNFNNPKVSSITLDAHKMAQAPYGTGIFLIRKDFMQYANTQDASYVEGEDYTLIGSRSGANAVSIWMILMKNGPFGWQEKIYILQKRTEWLCGQLEDLNVKFYRHQNSNIVTIREEFVSKEIASEFGLVPDNHKKPKWYKVVIMEHVTIEKLIPLIEKIKEYNS